MPAGACPWLPMPPQPAERKPDMPGLPRESGLAPGVPLCSARGDPRFREGRRFEEQIFHEI